MSFVSCGGTKSGIGLRVGRVDATKAGPEAVPKATKVDMHCPQLTLIC